MESIETLFHALSDRTRLRILSFLRDGELCVGDLVHLLEVPQPTASRHLALLRKSGLVTTRRAGLWAFYSLAEPTSELRRRLMHCLAAGRDEEPELARDASKAADLRKSGGCCPDVAQGGAGSCGIGKRKSKRARTVR